MSTAAASELVFTGERMVPHDEKTDDTTGTYWFHVQRYRFATKFVEGKRVYDVASGEGYGSDLLAKAGAASVTGVDISAEAVKHASEAYARDGLTYVEASATDLPFENDSADVFVSFETIEHFDGGPKFIDEISRVLVPGGTLVMSIPNPGFYDKDPNVREYRLTSRHHVREYYHDDLEAALAPHFDIVSWHHQGTANGVGEEADRVRARREEAKTDLEKIKAETTVESPEVVTLASYSVVVATNRS